MIGYCKNNATTLMHLIREYKTPTFLQGKQLLTKVKLTTVEYMKALEISLSKLHIE